MAGTAGPKAAQLRAQSAAHSAHNYHPLPVVIAEAEGAWVTDVDGTRYLDMLAAYSAINFGHRHPRLVAAAQRQLERVTLVSRAFEHDQFGPFCAELAALAGMEMVLPMNTGAEAVETAIKTARKWGYEVKGVPDGEAVIVVFDGNFHGRTTTIVSFSTDPDAQRRLRPVHAGLPDRPLRRPACARGGHGRERGGRAGRADPGRGRACWCRRPASWPASASCAPRTARCSSPTRSSPASAGPARRSPASTRTSSPTCTSWARRSAAASCRSRPWCRRATCSACSSPASTARRSAATRWPARSPARSSRCCRPASSRSARPSSARTCTTG